MNWAAIGLVVGLATGALSTTLAYGRADGAREAVIVKYGDAIAKVEDASAELAGRVGGVESDMRVVKVALEHQAKTLDEVRADVKALLRAQTK